MTFFPFDKQSLLDIDEQDRGDARLAVETAEKLCKFYQYYARSLYKGHDKVPEVPFTVEEAALADKIVKDKNKFTVPKSKKGRAAMKLFYGTQIRFYHHNPHMICLFGKNAKSLFLSMAFLEQSMPETYEPVDRYFKHAVQNMMQYIRASGPDLGRNPGKGGPRLPPPQPGAR